MAKIILNEVAKIFTVVVASRYGDHSMKLFDPNYYQNKIWSCNSVFCMTNISENYCLHFSTANNSWSTVNDRQ